MRALTFDFQTDTAVYACNDEYMFGPAFLVCPVMEPLYFLPGNIKMNSRELTRNVYLPKGTVWYNFWTGKSFEGGQNIQADASFETMPLFVRAGAIIPMGPFIQYSTEKSDPLEIRIFPGANGEFTLYEDENDNYNYEKGLHSLITFRWDDVRKTLSIDDRKGDYPGLLRTRIFNLVVTGEYTVNGVEINTERSKKIQYNGNMQTVSF
jgi:alpha-D-xyloside xylohydrolase